MPETGPTPACDNSELTDSVTPPTGRWTVGFLAALVRGYYFGSLLSGTLDAVRRGGGRVIAIQTADAGMGRDSYIDHPGFSRAGWDHLDAFIVAGDAVPDSHLRAIQQTGKPLILISREVPGLVVPTVVPDSAQGIDDVVEHLVGHGHRRIAFASRYPGCVDDQVRQQAYRDSLLARGLEPIHSSPIAWECGEISARATARDLLGGDQPPTAVIVSTDVTALMLMQALAEAGVDVPGDLAVIGFDDIEDAARHRPSLATVAQSFPLIGEIAGELALRSLAGEPVAPGPYRAPVSLVPRESCGCPGQPQPQPQRSPAVTGSAADLLAADLLAATGPSDLADPLDVPELIAGVYDHGGLNQARLVELRDLADRTVELFTAAASVGATDPSMAAANDLTGVVSALATAIFQLVPQDQSLPQVSALLRRFARTLAEELGADDVGTVKRLDDLAYDISTALFELRLRRRPAEHQYFQRQLAHYEISTDLLRRRNRASRSLDWLAQTALRAGCLAIREDGSPADPGNLTLVGSYDRHGSYQVGSGRCPEGRFPPREFLDLAGARPGDLTYLLQVRFDGSDWGLLALSGPIQEQKQLTLEMCNHWIVLLTVALDHQHSVRSLVRQREDLISAYERERVLTEEIRISEERYALAAEATNDGLWDWNPVDGTAYLSPRWKSLMRIEGELGDTVETVEELFARVHPADRPTFQRLVDQQLAGHEPTLELEYRVRAGDGSYRWMLTRARSVRDDRHRVIRLVGSMTDITERKFLEAQLRHDALYDALTGLPNRTLLLDRLNQAIEHARRAPEERFAVVFLDLDGFKIINDSLGHQVGDQVLVQVADRLSRQMRANDTVSRFGGDEFIVLLDRVREYSDIRPTVDRILAALSAPIVLNECTLVVTACAGIAVSQAGYQTPNEFIRDADTAMYRAKAAGTGTSMLFDESMHTGALARLHLESELRRALDEDQLDLHYQPIVDLTDQRIVGLEALIRWNHPIQGPISPADFLPVAESTGLILRIGRWSVDQICRRLRHWRRDGVVGADFTVSMNLSNRQFWDPDLRSYLGKALRDHSVPASALVLEVTEGVLMHNLESAVALLAQLRADSFKLHVDDFGTGYSSLEALHTFAIDALKIDRSFVARINADARSRELVRIMVAMGRNLGVDVIAEGIECEAQARTLAELGCPLVQGYYFARPLRGDLVTDLLVGRQPEPAIVG